MSKANRTNFEKTDFLESKKARFGSAIAMLGFHYILQENMGTDEMIARINAQTDIETIQELKRAGLLEGFIKRIEALENESSVTIVGNTEYTKIRNPQILLETKLETKVSILVGVASIAENNESKYVTHKMIGFIGKKFDFPIIILFHKDMKTTNITKCEVAEKNIVPNTMVGVCGTMLNTEKLKRKDGGEANVSVIIADYVEYTNEFVEELNKLNETRIQC